MEAKRWMKIVFRHKRRAGLRTELIGTITFLVAAALLFGGVLLVRLTEKELLEQRTAMVSSAVDLINGVIAETSWGDGGRDDPLVQVANFFGRFPAEYDLDAWWVVDKNLQILSSQKSANKNHLWIEGLRRALMTSETAIDLKYSGLWSPRDEDSSGYVSISFPVEYRGQVIGAVDARFSLQEVTNRVSRAYRLLLLYVMIYGTVLVFFGGYVLSRNVIGPITHLRRAAQQVAGGRLEADLIAEGPLEIYETAVTFNAMVSALKTSQAKSVFQIASLEKANRDLIMTQQELVRSEKMASVGHLAAGMAHEIGNPLGAIIGYMEFLRTELQDEAAKEIIDRSLLEANRIDRLVRDLLDFATPSKEEEETLDPCDVLREAVALLEKQGVFTDRRVLVDLEEDRRMVRIARHKLLQVFVNLLINAQQATVDGDVLRLQSGRDKGDIWISISDTGKGMPPEVIGQIFDPFFTTKGPDKGRGLGLSFSQRVVNEASGRLAVRSVVGEGSEFTVWLPESVESLHAE